MLLIFERSSFIKALKRCYNAIFFEAFLPNSASDFRWTIVDDSNLTIHKAISIPIFVETDVYLKIYETKLERKYHPIMTTNNQID